MLLYCVLKKAEPIKEETESPVVIFNNQQEAFSFIKAVDPDGEKDLQIYPVEA